MSALPEPRPIREYRGVDKRRFEAEIRPSGEPAVLRGIGTDWPAVQAARRSPEEAVRYLLSFHPPRPVQVLVGPPEIGGRFFYAPDFSAFNFTRGQASLESFLERLIREQDKPDPFAVAVQSEKVPELLPGFTEANHTELVAPSVVPRIWIGNRIQVAPHYDLMENVGVVILGRRRFTVFPPDQLGNLYIGPLEFTPAGTPVSLVDLANPDLERFPRFAEAAQTAQSAVLEPGDGIYLPFHWWHGVDSLDPVNAFVNWWWSDARPGLGSAYDALLHALYALRHLPDEQRAVWRMVFDHLVFATHGDPVAHLPDAAKGVLGPATPEQLARMRATLQQILRG